MLRVLSRTQFMGWMVWAGIRGPIGGPRQDWYHANLAMYAGKPWPEEVDQDDFLPYWAKNNARIAEQIAAEEEGGAK